MGRIVQKSRLLSLLLIPCLLSHCTKFRTPTNPEPKSNLNKPPVAIVNVGEGRVEFLPKELVKLDGSASSDPDDPNRTKKLQYHWRTLNGGQLTDTTTVVTYFSADSGGKYVVALTVSDSLSIGQPALPTITIRKDSAATVLKPVANAGKDDTTTVNLPVKLDGTRSFDPNRNRLTYEWTALNGGTISNPRDSITTFVASSPGDYVISLVVHKGRAYSAPDYKGVLVREPEPSPEPPVANAGSDTTYLIGEKIKLDGSKSQDPNNRPLTFHWIGAETNPAPVTLPNVAMPEITLPSPGKYIFILYVDNGLLTSAPDQVKIEVAEPDLYVSKTRLIEPNKVFRTLREALTAAQAGFLIFVEHGEYFENVDNFKSNIILLSTDPINTILNGRQGNASTLRVRNVAGVEIRGFTIREGGGVDPLQIDVAGVTCQDATGIRIIGNSIIENRGDGIRLDNAQGIVISDNDIAQNAFNGIRSSTSDFQVVKNRIQGNGLNKSVTTGGISVETRVGDASGLKVEILDNTFSKNEDNQIQLANNSTVVIDGNNFSGIGGIVTNDGAGAKLTLIDNSFRATSATPVFCQSKTLLTMQNNTLDNAGASGDRKAVDLINLENDSQMAGNKITGYPIGLIIFSSPILVKQNTFMQNQIAIKVTGMTGICPTLEGNTFSRNDVDLDYTQTNCPKP